MAIEDLEPYTSVEVADAVQTLAHSAFGISRILIDMSKGTEDIDYGTRMALEYLGLSLEEMSYCVMELDGTLGA